MEDNEGTSDAWYDGLVWQSVVRGGHERLAGKQAAEQAQSKRLGVCLEYISRSLLIQAAKPPVLPLGCNRLNSILFQVFQC